MERCSASWLATDLIGNTPCIDHFREVLITPAGMVWGLKSQGGGLLYNLFIVHVTISLSEPQFLWSKKMLITLPGSGRSPGGGNGNSLQYSCLGNLMDRWAWWATVHAVTKSRTRLSVWAHTGVFWRQHESAHEENVCKQPSPRLWAAPARLRAGRCTEQGRPFPCRRHHSPRAILHPRRAAAPAAFLRAPKSTSRAGQDAAGTHGGWAHAQLLLRWHGILGSHCPTLCLCDPFCKMGTQVLTFSWLNSIKSASEFPKYKEQMPTSKCPTVSRL